MSLSHVRKRDGRLVPFDEKKIEAAIAAAMRAVGDDDLAFANEVAGVVRLTLEASHLAGEGGASPKGPKGNGGVPAIEEIQDLVERALIELGRARVAKAYILYRDARARARDALAASQVEEREPATTRSAPRVTESGAAAGPFSPWSKGRIVAALMREADLPRKTAEEVASRVEARVFRSGLKRLSTSLVRELVDNELVELGLDAALRRQASVLLPLYDLRAILAEPAPILDGVRPAPAEALARGSVSARVAGEALRRYALEHVLDEPARARHLAGDFELMDLEWPHLWQWTSLCGSAFGGADSPREAFAAIDELVGAAGATARGVVLSDPEEVLAPLLGRTRDMTEWLLALGAASRASARRLDLCVGRTTPQRNLRVARALIVALGAHPGGPTAPRLFFDLELLTALGSDAELEAALERGLLRGSLIPTWSSNGASAERFGAPGCTRRAGDRAAVSCAGTLALNLPRLARRAGPWREDLLLEELCALVAAAIAAAERVFAFQHGCSAARPGAARGRVTFALTPIGIAEALRTVGDGEIRPEQGARVLGCLADAARRLSQGHDFDVELSAFGDEAVGARFAASDERSRRVDQRLLFEGEARASTGAYSTGLRLAPAAGCVPFEAEACLTSTVASGALVPLPEPAPGGATLAALARRFGVLRRGLLPDEIPAAPRNVSQDLFASRT